MMRLKTVSTISLIAIIVCMAYLGLCPPARDRVQSAVRDLDFRVDLRAQAARRPNDPQVWLAQTGVWRPAGSLDMTPYRQLFRLRPKWPVPYLLLGALLVSHVPSGRSDAYAPLLPRLAEARTNRVPSPEQQAKLTQAGRAFETARRLDPDNAAPEYALAYIAFAQHRDAEAMVLLRSGLGKRRWNLGEREYGIARYEADRRAMPDFEAGAYAHADMIISWAFLRELARISAGMAVTAEHRGNAERAILLRESMMHMGRLMMTQGYTLIDVLVGVAVWQIGVDDVLTPLERAQAVKGLREPKPGASDAAWTRWNRALRTAKQAKVAAYLREHGRADLAGEVLAFGPEHEVWSKQLWRAFDRSTHDLDRVFAWSSELRQAIVAGGASFGLLILCGLAWLLLAALGRAPVAVRWPKWAWCIVVMLCTGIAVGLSRLGAGFWGWASAGTYWTAEVSAPRWGGAIATVALPLLIIACLIVTWRARRRMASEQRAGFGRQYVGTLTAVMLPVTALLLLGCAALSVPTIRAAKHMARGYGVGIYQGELAYYGLKPPG